jgi:tetratricopeptide (TPR) repeat protein
MPIQRSSSLILLAGLLLAAAAQADLDTDLEDLSSRAAYGFYAEEPDVIDGARANLARLPDSDARVSQHRALAALRAAQLDVARGRPAGAAVEDCIESAERAAEQSAASAEPWIIVAACSALGARTEGLLHGRRFEHAVGRARSLDPENPHLPLVAAWQLGDGIAELDARAAGAMTAALEQAVPTFQARARSSALAAWGEAEALVLLGELYLSRGDIRAARDVIEHALLVAPGFTSALELERSLGYRVVGAL